MKIIFLFSFFLLSSLKMRGEVRYYQYLIKDLSNKKNPVQIITSSFDKQSFLKTHGGAFSIGINTMRSWKCMGKTSKSICKSPELWMFESILNPKSKKE